MRLVKALRRRIVALCAVACGALAAVACGDGCGDDDDVAPNALSAADCAPTLRLPVSPRIMEVLDDGSVHAGPPCATANCLAGSRGVWGYRDATSTKIEVGAQRVELPPPADGAAPSRFAAQHALRGFVIGKNLAVIDRGAELELVTPEDTARIAMPALREGEVVIGGWRDGDGRPFLAARPSTRGARPRTIALAPAVIAQPHPDATTIWDKRDARVGWLIPALDGAPARIERVDGTVVPLTMEVPAGVSYAYPAGDRYVLRARKRTFILAADGALVTEIPAKLDVVAHDGVVYAIDSRPPGGFHVVGANQLEPIVVPTPGHDLGGAPLPDGAVAQRIESAFDRGRALVVTRVLLATCTFEDRLALIDLRAKTARTLASGDVMRMHPIFAGDRFRYVEADASYESR